MIKKIMPVLKVVIICCLLFWAVHKFDFTKAKEIVSAANLGYYCAYLFFTIAGFVVLTLRWKMIIHGFCKENKPSLKHLFYVNMLTVFYMLFIPTSIAGETFRVLKLAKYTNNDYKTSTLIVALDRIVGAATWLIIFMIMPSPLKNSKFWIISAIGAVAFVVFRKKIKFFDHNVFDFSRHHPKDIAKGIFLSLAGQSLFIASNVMLFKCFNIDLTVVVTAAITSASALAGIVPISWLGISMREGSFLGLLPMYNVSSTSAVIIMTTIVFSNYLYGLTTGIIELIRTGWNFKQLKINNQPEIKIN